MAESYIPTALRRLVAERAAHCCEYCRAQAQYSADPLAVDHIWPRSLGGETDSENLALACFGCNQLKSNRISFLDPVTDVALPLFHPRQQLWREQFAWNEDFTLMLGLTPTGRATILALQLNRPGLVNLRRALYSVGAHPPGIS